MSKDQRLIFCTVAFSFAVLFPGHAQTLAFPGAQGFGRFASGGRAGTVYHVTTLANSGAGSFRDAVSQPNRIVVFDVGGYINLTSEVGIKRNTTIAGQSAPGGGIGITGAEVSCGGATNIIIRHVRFRPGSAATSTAHCINLGGTNFILDHVSCEFGPWNNVGGVNCDLLTIQNAIIANPINQQFGAHIEHLNSSCALLYNLWVSGHNRQPLASINTVHINNVVYNYQAGFTTHTSGDFFYDLINNYFITGPATSSAGNDFYQVDAQQSIYSSGNLRDSNDDGVLNGSATAPSGVVVLASPWSPVTTTIPTYSTPAAYRYAISAAGAWPRDAVDDLVISQVKTLGNGTTGTGAGTAGPGGGLYTSQSQTGLPNNGFGTLNGGATPLDSDADGVPDYWEVSTGSNPASNDSMTIDPDGYAKIEKYLNWLADLHALTTTNNPVSLDLWKYTSGFTNVSPLYIADNATNGSVTLSNSHFAVFTPAANIAGVGSFRFRVTASDGTAYTNTVSILISSLPPPSNLIWRGDGVANTWAAGGNSNWFNGADLATFNSGDNVTFDDSGSAAPSINLPASVGVGNMFVVAAQDYTIGGSAISSVGALYKVGDGKLTLNSAATYSGGATINEGVVQLGDGNSVNGSLNGNITNNDALILANPTAATSTASIGGSGTLTKIGPGVHTLNGTQTYTNLTTILAGTLEFSGTPPPGNITNNSTLTFKPASSMAWNGLISGSGSVVMNASGQTLQLNGANTFTGGLTNTAGNLILANSAAAGTGPVIYTAGSVMVAGGAVITNEFSIPSGATTDLSMQGTNGTGVWAGNIVNLGSGASWRPGADTGGSFMFTGTAAMGARNFIVPRGSVQIASNAVISATGTATAFGRDTSGGNRSANITIRDNAAITLGVCNLGGNQAGGSITLTLQNNAALSTGANLFNLHYVARNNAVTTLRLNGGMLTTGGFSKTNLSYTNIISFNGGVLRAGASSATFLPAFATQTANVQAGGARIDDAGFAIAINQSLIHDPALGAASDGGLTKLGAGTLTLANVNPYSGPTVISSGVLAITATPSAPLPGTTNIFIAAGAVFDASGAGGFTLGTGRKLWGDGLFNGNFTLGNGALLSPGTNAIGRLTFSNAVVFATGSSNVFELSKSPFTNDVVKFYGSLALAGSLLVTNLAGVLAAGDSFKLFDAAGYSGSFATVVLPALDTGLAWNTNQLPSSGIISVISTAPLVIGTVGFAGNNFTFGGSGGNPGGTYYVLSSTNVALARTNWTRELTNTFGPGGVFSVTNPIEIGGSGKFYLLQLP